jgi:hypothetical protein
MRMNKEEKLNDRAQRMGAGRLPKEGGREMEKLDQATA